MTKRTRPRNPTKPSKLLIALDAADRRLLEQVARAERSSLAAIVRRAIREYSATSTAR